MLTCDALAFIGDLIRSFLFTKHVQRRYENRKWVDLFLNGTAGKTQANVGTGKYVQEGPSDRKPASQELNWGTWIHTNCHLEVWNLKV